jgi:hypothetical protein
LVGAGAICAPRLHELECAAGSLNKKSSGKISGFAAAVRANAGQDYEVRYEAKKTGKSKGEVKRAIKRAGPSRRNERW